LIVVPDGVVWHIPFEALHATAATAEQAEGDQAAKLPSFPLIEKVRVRTVPTVGSITSRGRRGDDIRATAFVLGTLYPRDEPTVAQEAFDQLRPTVNDSVALNKEPPTTSATLATRYDRLVVWDDMEDTVRGPYAFAPMQIDAGKPGSLLGDWLMLPWNAPDEVIFPGFHTAAEESLGKAGMASGNELFLSACALMASGNDTVLLSRWRTGGQNSVDLIREYLQTSAHAAPSLAWRRSILLARENPIDPAREPRVVGFTGSAAVKAEHPFFWAGYLLVDLRGDPRSVD
jgi:hypothetical protein